MLSETSPVPGSVIATIEVHVSLAQRSSVSDGMPPSPAAAAVPPKAVVATGAAAAGRAPAKAATASAAPPPAISWRRVGVRLLMSDPLCVNGSGLDASLDAGAG